MSRSSIQSLERGSGSIKFGSVLGSPRFWVCTSRSVRRSNDDIAEVDVSFDDFAGLLPEGVQLGVVTTLTKTSADDHLTLLLAIGADTIGNSRANFVDAGERVGIRARATTRMIDELVDAASDWPDRCGQTGFDDRQTDLLADMLRTRLGSLK